MTPVSIPKQPDYGLDAPGVVKGMFAAGIAATCIAFIFPPLFALALIPLLLATSMLFHSAMGKLRLRDHLLRQRRWRGDEVVLDIGSGRGLMAIGAALRAPAGRIIAIDIWSAKDLSGNTPSALEQNAALEGITQPIEILTADARKLDLPDASVDVIVSVFCLHNIDPPADQILACREIARVLKPGGIALIADFPSAKPYVLPLHECGLQVQGPFRGEPISFTICGYLIATK